MGHPDSGRILAFIDGEAGQEEAAEIQVHLGVCEACRSEEESLRATSRAITGALGALDTVPSIQEAKARFQARQQTPRRSFWRSMGPLPKAASIALLLTGTAVSALPGSPVRRWVARGWELVAPTTTTDPAAVVDEAETPGPGALQGAIPETGAGLPVLDQGVEISLQGLSPDAELRVVWIDGTEAWVYAGEGTRFTLLDARLEVEGPPGPVRVELPRGPGTVLLRLDGNVILRKAGEEVEIVAEVRERTSEGIVFEPPRR